MRRALVIAALLCCPLPGAPARAQDAGGAAGSVMSLVRADRWSEADAAASRYADPVARKLVTYYRMLAPRAAGLAEIDAFTAANPDWPAQATLQRRREEALAAEPDDAMALAACDRTRPAGSAALERCAFAEMAANRMDDATRDARDAWIAGPATPVWEEGFLQRWGAALDAATQWRRFDRLAWVDTAGAGAEIARLAPRDRPLAEARIALRRDDPQAAALLAALPADQQIGPAIMLERAAWLRRGKHDAEALSLWLQDGTAAERAAPAEHLPAFWTERNILARHRLRDGDASGAFALADGAAQIAPEPVAEAAFLAGWVALRRLADPTLAAAHFAVLTRISSAAITQARGHYWLGRAAAQAGDAVTAARERGLASAYPSTFYGQLALMGPAGDAAALADRIAATGDPGWNAAQAAAFVAGEMARASVYLAGWGEPRRATAFLLRQSELARTPAEQALVGRLATDLALPQAAVAVARLAGREGGVLLGTGWPVAATIPPGSGVDPALALGVIRQESSFDPATVSPVGARGLMQLMPATAAAMARRLALPVAVPALTAEPAYNLRLGTAYLQGLLTQYAGAAPLAVAAYNAGPSRVGEWLAAYGDPRGNGGDMIDWIEMIPFGETRNYVQRVLENAAIYRVRLREPPSEPLLSSRAPA